MDDRKSLKERLWEDVKTMAALFVYLAVFLGAFTTYKRLLLAEYGVPFFEYGCALVEALLLSKVIVLGRALRLGERFSQSPLFMPTLYKTFCFCLLVLLISIGEHFVVGRWHGEKGPALVDSLAKTGAWEIPARMLTWFIAFIPLFAFFEVDRALGEGTLVKLFFASHGDRAAPEPIIPMRAGAETESNSDGARKEQCLKAVGESFCDADVDRLSPRQDSRAMRGDQRSSDRYACITRDSISWPRRFVVGFS